LLRRYQATIDQVSAHAKFGGNAFLVLFRILRQLPDPVRAIESSLAAESQLFVRAGALQDKVDQLIAALERSREKVKANEDLKMDRERFQEQVSLNGQVAVAQAVHSAESRLARAQQQHEEEVARMLAQQEHLQAEIDRLQESVFRAEQTLVAQPQLVVEEGGRVNLDYLVSQARSEGERKGAEQAQVTLRASAEAARAYEEQIEELRSTVQSQYEALAQLKQRIAELPSLEAFNKLKSEIAVMRRVGGNGGGEEAIAGLDSLEAWLLEANQRLSEELKRAKEEVAAAKITPQLPAAAAETLPLVALPEDSLSTSTLRSQRDRLRAVVEKKDVAIEQLQNRVEEKDERIRALDSEMDALKQRVRFLQSYKVSERSTLLGGGGGRDIESLGRGVAHQFRGFFEGATSQQESTSGGGVVDKLALKVSGGLLARRRGRHCFVIYAALVHGVLVWLLMVACT
jgi:hypothetical protein